MFAFHIQLTEDEYFEYCLQHYYSMPKNWKRFMTPKYRSAVFLVAAAIMLGSMVQYPLACYIIFGA